MGVWWIVPVLVDANLAGREGSCQDLRYYLAIYCPQRICPTSLALLISHDKLSRHGSYQFHPLGTVNISSA